MSNNILVVACCLLLLSVSLCFILFEPLFLHDCLTACCQLWMVGLCVSVSEPVSLCSPFLLWRPQHLSSCARAAACCRFDWLLVIGRRRHAAEWSPSAPRLLDASPGLRGSSWWRVVFQGTEDRTVGQGGDSPQVARSGSAVATALLTQRRFADSCHIAGAEGSDATAQNINSV